MVPSVSVFQGSTVVNFFLISWHSTSKYMYMYSISRALEQFESTKKKTTVIYVHLTSMFGLYRSSKVAIAASDPEPGRSQHNTHSKRP